MEKSALIPKRKKRKTRKCLNEIRNRSRHVNTNEEPEKSGKGLKYIKNNHSNMITMGRLTLAVYPKAVRSETITRPHLANIIQKQKLAATNIVRDSVIFSSNSSSIPDINGFYKASQDGKKSQNNIECFSGNSCNKDSEKTPRSCIVFSQVNEVPTSPNNLPKTNTSSSLSTVTSPGITETSKNLYDEFMEEVDVHFKHLSAALIHEDVMWKTKEQLRKNYVRGCQEEYEDNVLKCIQSNLVKNKSDSHIEGANEDKTNLLKSSSKDEKLDFLKEFSLSLSESPECTFSPSVTSDSEDKLSACSPCNIFSPKQSTTDTPEYIYYPHRLN